jgi:hypothetical protein
MPSSGDQRYRPKIADKFTVHYETGPHGWVFTYKVEKIDKNEKGSKSKRP